MVPKDVNIRLNGEMGALLKQRGVRSVNRWVNDLVAGHLGAGLAEEASPASGKNGLPLVASRGTDQAWFVYASGAFFLTRVVQADSDQIWFDTLNVSYEDTTDEAWSWSPTSMLRNKIKAFVKAPRDGREAVEVLKAFMLEHGVQDVLSAQLGTKLCREMNMLPSRHDLEVLAMELCGSDSRELLLRSEEGSNLEGRVIYADIVVTRKPGYALDVKLGGGLHLQIGGGYNLLPRDMSQSRNKRQEPYWEIEAGQTLAVIEQGTRLIDYPNLRWPNQVTMSLYESNRLHEAVDVACQIYIQPSRPKTKPSPPFTGHGTDFTKPLSAAR